jgi:hypothetical protein
MFPQLQFPSSGTLPVFVFVFAFVFSGSTGLFAQVHFE